MLPICAFTPMCGEDDHWLPQYLEEATRLGIRFAMHLDRCSPATKQLVYNHPLCVGTSESNWDVEFSEKDRESIFRLCERSGAEWALNWDVDETWETEFANKFLQLRPMLDEVEVVRFRYVNVWNHPRTIRVDGAFKTMRRDKLCRLNCKVIYRFNCHITNGPSSNCSSEPYLSDIVGLHWGHMTRHLRWKAKERWDRIYGKHAGKNPYGGWNRIVDETMAVELIDNPYITHIDFSDWEPWDELIFKNFSNYPYPPPPTVKRRYRR